MNMLERELTKCVQPPRAEAIAQLNDKLRKTGEGGTIVITRSVMNLPAFNPAALTAALAAYEAFDADNDPHGERDFGDLTLFGADLLWKIDYYDSDLRFGSNDPADSTITKRVLTVMLAEDW
jgi:hypothetical protein